jgi:hypothetical protein|nr:hypothetical protein [uncultured Acetatifactor sp.]
MKDERKFKEVIHTIKGAEKDKDKFLKASRLERRERKPMDFEDLVMVLFFITVWLAMILFFIGTR